jgi:LacI family transcriptional regulator
MAGDFLTRNIDASEIARLAGVSRATVSRVINNYTFVKPATRERVLKMIKKHSYSPNFSAQILAGKHSKTIGLFVYMETPFSSQSRIEDTHINFMTERIINTANIAGYYALVYQVYSSITPEEKKKIGDMFMQSRIDGGVFIGFPNQCDLIEDLIRRGCAVGIFNQYLSGHTESNRIVVRLDYDGISTMAAYVIGLGHRNVMYVGGVERQSGIDLSLIFRKVMEQQKIPVRDDFVLRVDSFSKSHTVQIFSCFMEGRRDMPSCILCGNDVIALGVIDVLHRQGYRVPEDISVLGSDDILVSQYVAPPLTTMRYDFDCMLKTLTAKVIEYIEKPFTSQYVGVYSGEIVVRKSCIPPADKKRDTAYQEN